MRQILRGLTLAWLAALFLIPGIARADGVRIELLPDPAVVPVDGVFDLELTVPVAGDSLNGYEITISYDNTVLTFIELSPRTLQEGQLMTAVCGNRWHLFNENDGVITISHILLCAGVKVAGPGVLYRLRFQAPSVPFATEVTIDEIEVYDAGTYVLPVVTSNATVLVGGASGLPDGLRGDRSLLQAPHPNPFQSSTHLSFTAAGDGRAHLSVYRVTGERVRVLLEDAVRAGEERSVSWDGRDDRGQRVASGVYLLRLQDAAGTGVRRVVYRR